MANKYGWLPLHEAAMYDCKLEVVQLLHEAYPAGARTKDKEGYLPVNMAVSEHVKRFFEKAADDNALSMFQELMLEETNKNKPKKKKKKNKNKTNDNGSVDGDGVCVAAAAACLDADLMPEKNDEEEQEQIHEAGAKQSIQPSDAAARGAQGGGGGGIHSQGLHAQLHDNTAKERNDENRQSHELDGAEAGVEAAGHAAFMGACKPAASGRGGGRGAGERAGTGAGGRDGVVVDGKRRECEGGGGGGGGKACGERRGVESVKIGVDGGRSRESEEALRECSVCMDSDKNHILIPCAHVCVCQECALNIMETTRQCPVCRAIVQHTFKVFL